jgi:hypothetical protein
MTPTGHAAVMTPHTKFFIVKRYFKSLSWINTAPTPIALSTALPTQIEPSFMSKKR